MLEYELKKLNLSEKREQQLKLPYIAKDVETIRIMTEIYCHAHHNTKEGLCPECEEFYLYSVKDWLAVRSERRSRLRKMQYPLLWERIQGEGQRNYGFFRSEAAAQASHSFDEAYHGALPRTSGKTNCSQTAPI